jgi:hypothetical protein
MRPSIPRTTACWSAATPSSTTDLQKAFNENWTRFGRPAIDFTEGAKAAAFADYAELFKSKYLETGNVDLAKAQAIEQLKKIWGVSHLNGTGSGTLTRYPPERAPAYSGIPDVAARIADEAVEAIKAETAPSGPQLERGAPEGTAIARDKIVLIPTPGGETAQAYMSGQPVPYLLSWFDKDGHLQMLNPGKAFVFDGRKARERMSEERRAGLARAVEGTGALAQGLGQAPADIPVTGTEPASPPGASASPAAGPAIAPSGPPLDHAAHAEWRDSYLLPGNRRPGLPLVE